MTDKAETPRRLPGEVPQHPIHGQRYFDSGRCVGCGGEKEAPEPYHCESCYERICPTISDYDDD